MSTSSSTSSVSSKSTLDKRYPRLSCTVVIHDSITGRSVLSTLKLSPEQLKAYGMGAVLAAYQTLITKLGGSKDFLNFLEVADPLWKSLLLEFPVSSRPSISEHPLAQKITKEGSSVKNGELYDILGKQFGIPAPGVSTFILSANYMGGSKNPVGYVVVVGTPEGTGDTIRVLQTVSQVVPKEAAEKIEQALWEGYLQVRTDGKVYGQVDVAAYNPKKQAKPLPAAASPGGGER